MTRSSGPKWPCCRRMDRRTRTRTRTPLIEHRTHPSGDLDPPSLLPPPPFIPCGLPPSCSIFVVIQSVNYVQEKPTSDYRAEGGSGDFGGRARVGILARQMRPPLLPLPRSVLPACSQVPTVSCTVRGQRPKRYALQSGSKGPRRLLEGRKGRMEAVHTLRQEEWRMHFAWGPT